MRGRTGTYFTVHTFLSYNLIYPILFYILYPHIKGYKVINFEGVRTVTAIYQCSPPAKKSGEEQKLILNVPENFNKNKFLKC